MTSNLVRRTMLLFLAALTASLVASMSRPINSQESNAVAIGMISALSWLGVALVASDGIPTQQRLELVVRRVAWAGGLLGLLGLVQFWSGQSLVDRIQIPGLTANVMLDGVASRSGFNRPAGTALHPIEFGTALTVMLPLALHCATFPGRGGLLRRWLPVAGIAVAIPLSISRSAIIATLVVLSILLPSWPAWRRRVTYLGILLLLAVNFVAVPGMLGTIANLFVGIAGDSSARSRSDSYSLAFEFVARYPIFGRGFLTFLPEYRILDNQYLGLLIGAGFVGLGSLLAVVGLTIKSALRARRATNDPERRSLALSLAASVSAGAVSYAFFDAFSFPLLAGTTFLAIGLAGGLDQLIQRIQVSQPAAVARAKPGR